MSQEGMKTELSSAGIARYLPASFDRNRIQVFATIGSTNTEAKRLAANGAAHGTILVANAQTAGRGRVGRSFYSPRDGGVYFSILLRPKRLNEEIVLITVAASVAAAEAIQKVCGVYPQIKWVNDLYYDGKKVCGILAELVRDPQNGESAVVLGVGMNCSCSFPDELCEIAGNLPPAEDMKNRLAAELSLKMSEIESMLENRKFLEEYRNHSMVIGKQITILQEPGSLFWVRGIGESGELILEDNHGGIRHLTTGEISIRLSEQIDKEEKP